MTLPSKSGGFQLPKIEAVSSLIWVESPGSVYFNWAQHEYSCTIYIESKAWRNEGRKVGTSGRNAGSVSVLVLVLR